MHFIECLAKSACESGMYCKFSKKTKSQKWFDADCVKLKKEVRVKLRNCKKSNFEKISLKEYLEEKSNYQKMLYEKKAAFNNVMINHLSTTRDSDSF